MARHAMKNPPKGWVVIPDAHTALYLAARFVYEGGKAIGLEPLREADGEIRTFAKRVEAVNAAQIIFDNQNQKGTASV